MYTAKLFVSDIKSVFSYMIDLLCGWHIEQKPPINHHV